MKQLWKIAALALAVVAAILVASFGKHIGKSAVDSTYKSYKEGKTQESIEELLEQIAKEINKQASKMGAVNDRIKADSAIAGPGKQFTYLFTVYQPDQLNDEQLRILFVANRDRLCASKLRQLLESGVRFTYRYRDKDGKWVKDVSVKSTDCS